MSHDALVASSLALAALPAAPADSIAVAHYGDAYQDAPPPFPPC